MYDNLGSRLWEAFTRMEEKHQLFGLMVGGVPYWDYVRFHVYSAILEAKKYTDAVRPHNPSREGLRKTLDIRIRRLLKRLWHILRYPPIYWKKYEYIVIGLDNSRWIEGVNQRYSDFMCDPVIEHLGSDNCLVLETFDLPLGQTKKPMTARHVISSEQISLSINLKGSRIPALVISEKEKEKLRIIGDDFSRHFDTKVDLLALLPRVAMQEKQAWIFGEILAKVRPRAVMLVCSYGKEGYISACKKYSIPVIELQHGVMTSQTVGYEYPQPGDKKLFPDYFFSFGSYWMEDAGLPIEKSHIFNVGYPYFSNNFHRYAEIQKQKQILVISQWTIGKELSLFAGNLVKLVPPGWKVIYKLHPAEVKNWQEHYGWLADTGIEIVGDNRVPLYQLMAQSTIQVGVYSTAIFEGVAFGCKTCLVNLPGIEHMESLVAKGYATVVSHPEEVIADMEHQQLPDCTELFADNWQARFDAALEQCLGARP